MRFVITQRDVVRGRVVEKAGTKVNLVDRPQGRLVRKGDVVVIEKDELPFYRAKSMTPEEQADGVPALPWTKAEIDAVHGKKKPADNPDDEPAAKASGKKRGKKATVPADNPDDEPAAE